jgi:hypothetical protein
MSVVSLDHLVGRCQQRFRDGEAEGLGGFEVDDKIEFGWLHHRQIDWFLAFENAPRIDASLVVRIAEVAAIADQAACESIAGSPWWAVSAARCSMRRL